MKKILKDEYVKRLSEKFNNQIELVGEYTKFKEETLHLCTKCGEQFMISPETMLRRDHPCQNCSAYDPNTSTKFRETRVGAPKKTIDQYRSQLSEKFNGQIEVLSDTYDGNRNPLLHLCTKCGETFEANPFDMMRRKNACLFCGEDIYKREGRKLGSRKKTHEHYESVDYFGGIETLTKTQERDKIKKELLLEHKIETFEIPYWDFDDIEDILRDLLKAA